METRLSYPGPPQSTETQMTHSEPNRLDLAAINAVQVVITNTTTIANQFCQWEQDCSDAAAEGRILNALMLEHSAFAAQVFRTITSSKPSALFGKVLDAQFSSMPSLEEFEVLVVIA